VERLFTYQNDEGRTEQNFDITLPFTCFFEKFNNEDSLCISVQNNGENGCVASIIKSQIVLKCSQSMPKGDKLEKLLNNITKNGDVLKSSQSCGGYVIATASTIY
jgi:hypothetical protein